MNHEIIYDIEKRVAELKFLERDLIKERDIIRLKSLDKAEKSGKVEEIIKNFFLNYARAERKEIVINSFPSKFTGRDDDEFMSEVKVELRFKPINSNTEYNEISVQVYLNKGFEDEDVIRNEKQIMDKLVDIRNEVEKLKESKKSLKQNT